MDQLDPRPPIRLLRFVFTKESLFGDFRWFAEVPSKVSVDVQCSGRTADVNSWPHVSFWSIQLTGSWAGQAACCFRKLMSRARELHLTASECTWTLGVCRVVLSWDLASEGCSSLSFEVWRSKLISTVNNLLRTSEAKGFSTKAGNSNLMTYLRRGALGGMLATNDSSTSARAILRGVLGPEEAESVVDASELEFE